MLLTKQIAEMHPYLGLYREYKVISGDINTYGDIYYPQKTESNGKRGKLQGKWSNMVDYRDWGFSKLGALFWVLTYYL